MANVKITELTAATALAGTDVLPIVDVGADATKKVSVSDLLRNLPDGSAASPSLAFADDQNTGVLSPGDNSLAFATSGTQRLVIDSSGRVGIGTSNLNTNTVLSVHKGDSSESQMRFTNSTTGEAGNNGFLVGIDSSEGGRLFVQENNYLRFGTNNTERLRIDSSGNVGIGTSSPSNNLDILSTTSGATVNARVGSTAASGVNNANLIINNGGTGNATLRFDYESSTNRASIGVPQSTQALFFTTAGSEKARIDSSGRVGIGTSSPSAKLEIGNIVQSGSEEVLTIDRADGTQLYSIGWDSTGNEVSFSGNTKNFVFKNGSSSSETMRINSSGRLLVGTTTAFGGNSEMLQIARNGGGAIALLRNDTSVSIGNELGAISWYGNDSTASTYQECATIRAIADVDHADNDKPTRLIFSTTADNASSPTERARISSNGRFSAFGTSVSHVFRVSQTSSTDTAFVVNNNATNTTDGTLKFVVRADGDAENTNNSYGALSDAKLKENIVDAGSQWDDIKNIRVRNYNFIEGETHRQIGVVAQEVETVSPGLVKERKDIDAEGNTLGTTTKAVNYSVLYMKAVKALQEAMDRIETLEAKVAALEAQ